MKITKNQLRRIIKEEKARMLAEGNEAMAQRALGAYAPAAKVDALIDLMGQILQETEISAIDDGMMDDEAEEMAQDALILAVAEHFQALGLMAPYQQLLRTLI